MFGANTRLDMPALLYPGRKPVGNVKIDRAHPLSKVFKAVYLERSLEDFNIISQERAVLFVSKSNAKIDRDGISFNGEGGVGISGQAQKIDPISDKNSGVVVIDVTQNNLRADQFIFAHSDFANNSRAYIGTTGGGYVYLRLGSSAVMGNTIPIANNARHVLAVSWSGTTCSVALNGVLYSNVYTYAGTPFSLNLYTTIGGYIDSTAPYSVKYSVDGTIHAVLAGDERVSDSELQDLSINPYQFLIPA